MKFYKRVRTSQVQNERRVLSNILPCIMTEPRSISLDNPDDPESIVVTDGDFGEIGLDWTEGRELTRPNLSKL